MASRVSDSAGTTTFRYYEASVSNSAAPKSPLKRTFSSCASSPLSLMNSPNAQRTPSLTDSSKLSEKGQITAKKTSRLVHGDNELLSNRYQELKTESLNLLSYIQGKTARFERNKKACETLVKNASSLLQDSRKSPQGVAAVSFFDSYESFDPDQSFFNPDEISMIEWIKDIFSSDSFENLCENLNKSREALFLLGVSESDIKRWIDNLPISLKGEEISVLDLTKTMQETRLQSPQTFEQPQTKDHPLLKPLIQLLVDEIEILFESHYIDLKEGVRIPLGEELEEGCVRRFSVREFAPNGLDEIYKITKELNFDVSELVSRFKGLRPSQALIESLQEQFIAIQIPSDNSLEELVSSVEKCLIKLLKQKAETAFLANCGLIDRIKFLKPVEEYEKSGVISQIVKQELLKWKDSLGIFQILQRASEESEKHVLTSLTRLLVDEVESLFESHYIDLKEGVRIPLGEELEDGCVRRFSAREFTPNGLDEIYKITKELNFDVSELISRFKELRPSQTLIESFDERYIPIQSMLEGLEELILLAEKCFVGLLKQKKETAFLANCDLIISQIVEQELLKWKDSLGLFQILQRASEEFEKQQAALDDEF